MLLRCLLTVAVLIPATVLAEPPRAPEEARAPWTVTTIGTAVFLGSYGLSVGFGSQSLDRDNAGLYVPLLGPWIALGAHSGDCPLSDPDCDDDTRTKALLVIDGIAQATGALMVVSGLVEQQKAKKRDERFVKIRPVITRGNPGIAVIGRF